MTGKARTQECIKMPHKLSLNLKLNYKSTFRFRSEHATFRDLIAHRMCLFRDDLQLISEPFETASEVV